MSGGGWISLSHSRCQSSPSPSLSHTSFFSSALIYPSHFIPPLSLSPLCSHSKAVRDEPTSSTLCEYFTVPMVFNIIQLPFQNKTVFVITKTSCSKQTSGLATTLIHKHSQHKHKWQALLCSCSLYMCLHA